MDDSLIMKGPGNISAGNALIQEVLNVITTSGQRWSGTNTTQLSQAIFNQVIFEGDFIFFEDETLYMYD